ncbi:MAG: class 1 fructose-bisphosphatase [Salinisphaera sp.]|jgi:fructose-1,6-bisphosphatase I|nr:class 1 fructose-bisphosphatase [Salinisphaera sp.]
MTTGAPIGLKRFLLDDSHTQSIGSGLASAIDDLAQASRKIAHLVGRGSLAGMHGSAGSENIQGETQKKLDIVSNDVLLEATTWSEHWSGLASEEMDNAVAIRNTIGQGGWLCVFDPLDGSSNIDINGSVGTIFSILPSPKKADELTDADFLQPGTNQAAAGFMLYGPATVLVLTTGDGVNAFTLDTGTGEYLLTAPDLIVPGDTREFAVNMSNRRYWSAPIQRYIDECIAGRSGPRGFDFSMRYAGSMVADLYRLLINSGIFLYPWESRDPDRAGKLRLLYEANPMSFIVEQAGGAASTGTQRIMDIQPNNLHQRCPVIIGSKNEVERVERLCAEAEPAS